MKPSSPSTPQLRSQLDRLDADIQKLVAERDRLATELLRTKKTAPYDPVREHEIAGKDEAFWLPLLRRVRTAEGARKRSDQEKLGAFPDGGFVLAAGPCAVDAHVEETVDRLAAMGISWIRAGAWKPRTFPWSFQGLGFEGLKRLRAAADRHGLRVVSEVVSEADAEKAAAVLDVVQVGARNCQNFALLKVLAGLGRPVLLKRGPACTVEEWLGAAAYLDGRVPVTLCERGVRGFDPCFRNLLDIAGALLAKRLGGFQTIIDPSHGTGVAGLVGPMVLAAQACGLDGAIVEVHADPKSSPSDADQALRLDEMELLVRQVSRRESVLSRNERPQGRRVLSGSVGRGRKP